MAKLRSLEEIKHNKTKENLTFIRYLQESPDFQLLLLQYSPKRLGQHRARVSNHQHSTLWHMCAALLSWPHHAPSAWPHRQELQAVLAILDGTSSSSRRKFTCKDAFHSPLVVPPPCTSLIGIFDWEGQTYGQWNQLSCKS